ncbi:helix-turn-helix domain-containing protein [Embleya sp. MST-111070]|uniref:helix-turn-helix domain-containing protein n=1 Tax=Embleya sp. MST-111070 TaxID=3398231 RepID=UPI003F74183D
MTAVSEPADDDVERARLGQRLRSTRDYLGLSQQQVAERTGIPRSAVSDIERGVRKVDTMELKKLARLYRLSASYFLDEDEDADAGEHALAGMPRTRKDLTEGDRIEVARFIQYLKARRAAEAEAESSDASDGPSASPELL